MPEPTAVDNPGTGGASQEAQPLVNPLLAVNEPVADNATEPPVEETPVEPVVSEPPKEELILGKFKSADEVVKAYQEAQSLIGRQGQEMSELRRMVESIQAQQQKEPEPTPVDENAWKEEWNEEFYENPLEAIQKLLERAITPRIQPLEARATAADEQEFWDDEVAEARKRYEDFDKYVPIMTAIADSPEGQALQKLPNAIDIIYKIAKGEAVQAPETPEPPKDPLTDPEVRQRFLEDEGLRNEVIKQHMESVKTQNENLPKLMGSKTTGEPPAIPAESPKNLREGTRAFLASLKK